MIEFYLQTNHLSVYRFKVPKEEISIILFSFSVATTTAPPFINSTTDGAPTS